MLEPGFLGEKSRLEFLRRCHRQAPSPFFNGNTFADVARVVWRPDRSAAELMALPEGLLRERARN